MAGALAGLKVLDLSRVLAGPWAGQILADLGAEVIKVEKPGTGDDTRGWGPPYVKDRQGQDTKDAAYFMATNRGKKSIAIDFHDARGAALVKRLAKQSDILIENFKTGGLAKYGLDYASLAAQNPRLVYCSITGFGQTGPNAALAGYDFIIQGMAGLMSITGSPASGPQKVGTAVADLTTGMYAVIAVLAALRHRDATGQGQHIDMALFDTQLAWLANQNMNYLIGGMVPQPIGNAHPNIVPYQDFGCKDGHLIVAVGNDRQFARLAKLLGQPEWACDARFTKNADRVRHRDILIPMLAEIFSTKPVAHWRNKLDDAGIPCGPINNIAQAFGESQVTARGLRFELPHSASGSVPQVACPIQMSATPPVYRQAPPRLGEHSDEILDALELSAGEITELKDAGIVA